MVEHAAVNRVVVGSSPTFGAILTVENQQVKQNSEICRTDSAQNPGDSDGVPSGKVKFPVKVTFRKAEAKIYGKSEAYPFYRLCYYAAGKRHVRSFATYGEARKEADAKVKEIANGSQSIALTTKEATAALSIRDALDAFRRDTGRTVTALEAVTGFLDAAKLLPDGCNLTEAVRAYSATLATIKPKLIAEAVEEFIAVRKPKAEARDGKRSQLSPVYEAHIQFWLREFSGTFPGHQLGDLNRELLAAYIGKFSGLSAKSRNDRRAAVAMFIRWCQRQDYLPASNRLLEADAMQREIVDSANTDFYRPE